MNLPLFHERKGFGGEDGADGMIVLHEGGKIIMPPKLPSQGVTPRQERDVSRHSRLGR